MTTARELLQLDKAAHKAKEATLDFLGKNVFGPISSGTREMSDDLRYYVGPHAGESLERVGQVAQLAPYYAPGLGDMLDVGRAAYDAVDNAMSGKWGKAAGAIAWGGASVLPGMFIPIYMGKPGMSADDAARLSRAQEIWDTTMRNSDEPFDAYNTARKVTKETGLTFVPGSYDPATGQAKWVKEVGVLGLTPIYLLINSLLMNLFKVQKQMMIKIYAFSISIFIWFCYFFPLSCAALKVR